MFNWIMKLVEMQKAKQEEKERKEKEEYDRIVHGKGQSDDYFIDLTPPKRTRKVKKGFTIPKLPENKK